MLTFDTTHLGGALIRRLVPVLAAAALYAAPAQANLLTDGDFQGATLQTASSFTISTGLNEWHVLDTNYTIAQPGSSGGGMDDYAMHTTAGNGSDHRLIQLIDTATAGIGINDMLKLTFDYIYNSSPGADANPKGHVYVVGFGSDRSYSMFGGTGPDGANFDNDTQVNTAGDKLLADKLLDFTVGSSFSLNEMLMATVDSNYAYIGVIFQSGCFVNGGAMMGECDGPRGYDNVSLLRVPEPGTMALFGLGLAGLGFARRRRAA